MKYSLIPLISVIFTLSLFSQKLVIDLSHYDAAKIHISDLDKLYPQASEVNPGHSMYETNNDSIFYYAWVDFLHDINQYLCDHQFSIKGQIQVYCRVYFASDGTIDYFNYNTVSTIPASLQKQFHKIMEQFIKTGKIKATAASKFVQCGSVILSPLPSTKK